MSSDDFFAELTLVKTPSTGGRFKKYRIKSLSFEDMLRKKHCIIPIRNKDELCCARAIVTVQAWIEKESQYGNLRRGCPIQTRLAQELHRNAQVPERACGTEELNAFQTYLAPKYQLVVFEGIKGQLVYKNAAYDDAEHVLALLKIKQHYHAITSIPAFLNRGYFCRHCKRAYNSERAEDHNCKGQNCIACRRGKKRCKNFATWVVPTHHCSECNRMFYGHDCFEAHKKGKKPVCKRFAKCGECCKLYKHTKEHVCYRTVCGNCGQYKDIHHICFIQPYKAKNDVEEEEDEEDWGEADEEEAELPAKKKPDPLIIAFDIECEAKAIEVSEDKVFVPVLIGWSTLREVEDYHQVTTIKEFLAAMFSKSL